MNRKELLTYARSLPPITVVTSLLASIDATLPQIDSAVASVKNVLTCIDMNRGESEYQEVNNLTHFAVQYERAHATLTGLFLALAQTLQGLGHKIDY